MAPRATRHAWRWLQGSDKMVEILRLLPSQQCAVLHDVHLSRGRVDHVVVAPTGVYVIEPRSWVGRIKLGAGNRLRHGPLSAESTRREAIASATLVRRRLAASGIDRPVTAVIALLSGSLPDGPIDLRDVVVIDADDVPALVQRRQVRMKPFEVDVIRQVLAATARRS